MTRQLTAAALLLAGCAGVPPKAEFADLGRDRAAPWGVVRIDRSSNYLVDPRTESCFLVVQAGPHNNPVMSPVSCAKLKRNVPEAAGFITWDPAEGAATRVSPASPRD